MAEKSDEEIYRNATIEIILILIIFLTFFQIMFTGIVQGIRRVSGLTDFKGGRRLLLKLDDLALNLSQGASVSVNGVCLTAVCINNDLVEFDIIQESLNRSNLGLLKIDDYVNIERACCFGDEIGGHQVTGHIDCKGEIKEVKKKHNNCDLIVACDNEWISYLFPKGWIAIDGISLTVVDVGKNWFSISLIPETLEKTLLGGKNEGDYVNLEFEHITKVIVKSIERIMPLLLPHECRCA